MRRFSQNLSLILLGLAIILGLFIGMDILQRYVHYQEISPQSVWQRSWRDGLKTVYFNIFKSEEHVPTEFSRIEIKIPSKVLRKLEQTRSQVATKGISQGIELKYFKAQMRISQRWVPIRIRLRGLMADHYSATRPSLKIKLNEFENYKGMREFHLMDPYDKGLTADKVVFDYLGLKGLPTLYNEFTSLIINGKRVGTFQLFEASDKSIFTRRNLSETLASKFSDTSKKIPSPIKIFKNCVNRSLPCSDEKLLDLIKQDHFAWSLALSLFVGSYHAWDQDNLVIYYDPVDNRIGIVPWDWGFRQLNQLEYPGLELPERYHIAKRILELKGMKQRRNQFLKQVFRDFKTELVKKSELEFQRLSPLLMADNRHPDLKQDIQLQQQFIQTLYRNKKLLESQSFDFPTRLSKQKTRVFGPGRVEVKKGLILPLNQAVEFKPGLQLLMHPGAFIIVRGPFKALGTFQRPIHVQGLAGKNWAGLAILGAGQTLDKAEIEHMHLKGGSGIQVEHFQFSGALSIHHMQVHMKNSSVLKTHSVDAINIKGSKIVLEHNRFDGSQDDLLDIDFCQGDIKHNSFQNSGGDCLDFSGSLIQLSDNKMQNCKDKGISIGERSQIVAHRAIIQNVQTGVAVKDDSELNLSHSNIQKATNAFAFYRKKSYFEAPRAKLEDIVLNSIKNPLLQTEEAKVQFKNVSLYTDKQYQLPKGIKLYPRPVAD